MNGWCVGQGVLDANHWKINKKAATKRSQVSRCTGQKYTNIMFKTKIWYKNRYCNTIWQLPLHRHNVERTIFISRGTAPGKPSSKWRHQSQDRLSAPEAKELYINEHLGFSTGVPSARSMHFQRFSLLRCLKFVETIRNCINCAWVAMTFLWIRAWLSPPSALKQISQKRTQSKARLLVENRVVYVTTLASRVNILRKRLAKNLHSHAMGG